jgi:hypothetical protein
MVTKPNTSQPKATAPHPQARSEYGAGAADAKTPALPPRLLDLHAAGRYLGLSYWTTRDLVFAGVLPTVKLPCPRAGDGRVIRRVLIDRRDLDTLIEQYREAVV